MVTMSSAICNIDPGYFRARKKMERPEYRHKSTPAG